MKIKYIGYGSLHYYDVDWIRGKVLNVNDALGKKAIETGRFKEVIESPHEGFSIWAYLKSLL